MKEIINHIRTENLTINQNINIGAADRTQLPEDITLSDMLSLLGGVQKAETKPTAKALRERKLEDGSVEQIPPLAEAMDGTCKVYSNGYAVYTNGVGTTVLWLADCRAFTYQFDELNQKEKEYLPQRSEVGEDVMGDQPWFMAVMLRGDHQVEQNSMNRTGGRRDKGQNLSLGEITEKEETKWRPGCRFENPEMAYIRKEMIQEQLAKLTDKQREVFLLYHRDGFNQYEIAAMLGIRQPTVREYLKAAEGKIRNFQKIF